MVGGFVTWRPWWRRKDAWQAFAAPPFDRPAKSYSSENEGWGTPKTRKRGGEAEFGLKIGTAGSHFADSLTASRVNRPIGRFTEV